ncbi:MAG: hypothetical protein AVDCRST_MAG30-4568, partial [uncultured Solirubrobacteraceae bacterium]
GRADPRRRASRPHDHAGPPPHRPLRGRLGRLQPDPHRRGVRPEGRAARPDPARPVDDGAGRPRADRGRRRTGAPQAPLRAVPRDGGARAGDHGDLDGPRGPRRHRRRRHAGRAGGQRHRAQRRGRADRAI